MRYVKHSEMYWRFVDYESDELRHRIGDGIYLGEAGNSSYDYRAMTRFMRLGDEVLVQNTYKPAVIIPADCEIQGLGPDCEVRGVESAFTNLAQLVEGVEYDWLLRPYRA
jgi:hypothetical protein